MLPYQKKNNNNLLLSVTKLIHYIFPYSRKKYRDINYLNKENYKRSKENIGDSFLILVIFIILVKNVMIKIPETITEKIKHI